MASKETGASEHALIDLIYRHLKESGYKKAASALKQHAPQVKSGTVKVSLSDIFKKWLSEEQEKKNDEGKASQTESTTNAAHNTRREKKKPATPRNQKRKRSEVKTCKISSVVEDHKKGGDSDLDSDSSLDVDKWKKLALQLSDADFAKMDAFTNFTTSTAKSTKKRKPAQPKKQPLPKKTKAKTATTPTKTDKKSTAKKASESDKIKTPSEKAIITDPNVKSPESKTAPRLSDQVATPKTAVSNGLSESDGTKVKRKKKQSLSKSHDIETPSKKAEKEKTTESEPADTPCRMTRSKSNADVTTPGCLETPSRVTDPDEHGIQTSQCGSDSVELSELNSPKHSKTRETKAKKDKSKKKAKIVESVATETSLAPHTEDGTSSLKCEQSKINQVSEVNPAETPSKKAKSKKSKERQEPGDVAMLSGECELEVNSSHSNQHQTETLSASVKKSKSVAGSETVEKQSKKAKKSLLEPNGTEHPPRKIETQAAASILEPLSSETPSKKSKTKKATENHQTDSPSKKAVVDVGEGELAANSSSSKSDHVGSIRKSKRKRADSYGENLTSSVTEHVSKEQYNSLMRTENSTENESQESVLAVEVEGTPEPKKRKKHKKDKEKEKNETAENVEEVPPAEELADSLPSSQKKKKKKKQKHREEDVPPVSDPAPEEDSPKKKKKSSKKKEHADVSEQEPL
ncbi:muscle M-line assembly protein unc-89 isoform X2 [Hemibagrus wyckioides]|uniref:muscle M-line assembly protein unc-89 isoform X2 n=1 Tax=Hemibagrus wyckioides TaxID=337641 RepID=UPI00266CE623|nr:muscle M-line assembly protein unc-89 isoform X2 [Hemibagrus wyckioides]